MVSTHHSSSIAETQAIAVETIADLKKTNIICLFGELASGKTTFVQGIGSYFGLSHLLSPTYVIARQYPLTHQQFDLLIHLDLYRLGSSDDLKALNLDEIWNNPRHLVIIEWPDRIASSLPANHIDITIKQLQDDSRQIIISTPSWGYISILLPPIKLLSK